MTVSFIIPYFGKFPPSFPFWLISCRANNTIDWLIFTNDYSVYEYPPNVKVTYCSFEDIKNRIQEIIEFPIYLDRPWKICDYRPAYGEIFQQELKGYDFWGYCDVDIVWGNIRKFITDDILIKYDRIGFQGHSTLYKNDPIVNARYREKVSNEVDYREAFTHSKGYCFDETGMDAIYNALGIEYYKVTNFAHLRKYDHNFFLGHLSEENDYKNKYHVFIWKNGQLKRMYLLEGKLYYEEYMYIHFWCRPMSYCVEIYDPDKTYIMYSDVVKEAPQNILPSYVKRFGKGKPIRFYAKALWKNRKKLNIKRIVFNIKGALKI